MAIIAFLLNVFLQIFAVVYGKDSYFELIVSNYGFILAVLGIKGFFETRNITVSTNPGEGQPGGGAPAQGQRMFSRNVDF